MSAKIDVIGKSREDIGWLLRNKRPQELLDIIYELATMEPFFSPRTIAKAREMSQRKIVKLCKDGTMPGVHMPLAKGYRVSLSGLRQWDESTALKLSNGNGSAHS